MNNVTNINAARAKRNDEFYTQISDIEKELKHYRDHFSGKVVYCNCDDPRESNFFRYFSYNFERLGLRKLITTCYKSQDRDLFSTHNSERAIYLEYNGDRNDNRIPDPEEIGVKELKGDGDFRSSECIDLLKQADIVVTNPPFSLFREYVGQLMKYDKKFLIIGNTNAITYKEIFPLIRDNNIWLGSAEGSVSMHFIVSKDYAKESERKKAGVIRYLDDGTPIAHFRMAAWFTNLDHGSRNQEIILHRSYTPKEYPHYDNYDAVEVSKTKNIPMDYDGLMGVPISFLQRYNPKQFEIIGLCWLLLKGKPEGMFLVNGKRKYRRIVVRNRNPRKAVSI